MNVKILLMGKPGVGKSSFVNYFIGKEVAPTGVGRPLTQKTSVYKSNVNGIGVEVYDTKGLEAKISADMKADFIADISKHNVSDDFWNHYHSIFYCVSMGNPRMDEFEIQFLKDIQTHIFQPVNIILTHCDDKDNKKIEEMKVHIRTSLKDRNFPYTITPVCSVSQKKRLRMTVPFGREELLRHLFDQVWQDASVVMANKCVPMYKDAVKIMDNDISKYIDSEYKYFLDPHKTSRYCHELINAVPTKEMQSDYSKRIQEILATVKEYRQFIEVYYKALGKEDMSDMFQRIFDDIKTQMFHKFDYEKLGLHDYLTREIAGFWGGIKFIIQGKKVFCGAFDDCLHKFVTNINDEELKGQLIKEFNSINEKYRRCVDTSKQLNDALKNLAYN